MFVTKKKKLEKVRSLVFSLVKTWEIQEMASSTSPLQAQETNSTKSIFGACFDGAQSTLVYFMKEILWYNVFMSVFIWVLLL